MKARCKDFGVSTLLFRELPLKKSLETISTTRFSLIDLSIVPPTFCPHYDPLNTNSEDDKKLKDIINSYELKVSSLNIFPGYYNKDNPQEVTKFIKRCIEIAKLLDVASVTIPSGAKVPEAIWLKDVKYIKNYLLNIAKVANDNNIFISIETPHIRTLTETIDQSRKFHEVIDSNIIKCTFDTSHAITNLDYTLTEGIDEIGIDKINHIHLRDTIGEEISFTPGKGSGNFESFFHKIREGNYQGVFIFELEYHDYSEEKKYKELEFAYNYCNNIYCNKKIPLKFKIKSSRLYQFYERFSDNPKREVKRHKKLFLFLKKSKPFILSLLPDYVYIGKWKRKYRFNKTKVVHHKPQSIVIQKNPQKSYRIAVVGCGWAGMEMHAPGFERLNNTKIIGGYDIDEEKTKRFAKRFHCDAYHELDELIQKGKPDIVAICSREWAHYDAAVYSLKNGVDVFSEKLMATRYKHAKEMVDLAKEHSRTLGINYNYRFMPGIRKIKELIEQKALGNLSFFNINVHAMSYAHALDLLSYLGGKIITVSGSYKNDDSIRVFGNTDWALYDDDILYVPSISASVTCEFENGSIGVVNSSYFYNLYSFVLSIEGVFEEGAITLNGINMFNTIGNLTYFSRRKIRKVNMNYKKDLFAKGYEYTFYNSIESFMRNHSSGVPPETPGEQGLFNIELEKAIHRSNKEKIKIRLS